MNKALRWVAIAAALGGATGCLAGKMNSWMGHRDVELVSTWGAPERETKLSDGGRVMTWVSTYTIGTTPFRCEKSFTISAAGVVTSWSAHGC